MSEFNAQDLAKTAWAFATAGRSDAALFGALAQAAAEKLSEFNAQELANTAWAFTTAGRSDVALFAVLAQAAKLGLQFEGANPGME